MGTLLIICFVLTCVLWILVITKAFRIEQGIDNLEYIENPKDENEGIDEHGDGSNNEQSHRRVVRTAKVDPEIIDPQDASKRVLFKESGPQFIHDLE